MRLNRRGRRSCSDLGAHVDGYVALVATTVVVGEAEVTGKKADAIQAAKVASDAIIRLLQPGKKNSELTPLIEKVRCRPRCDSCRTTEHFLRSQRSAHVRKWSSRVDLVFCNARVRDGGWHSNVVDYVPCGMAINKIERTVRAFAKKALKYPMWNGSNLFRRMVPDSSSPRCVSENRSLRPEPCMPNMTQSARRCARQAAACRRPASLSYRSWRWMSCSLSKTALHQSRNERLGSSERAIRVLVSRIVAPQELP